MVHRCGLRPAGGESERKVSLRCNYRITDRLTAARHMSQSSSSIHLPAAAEWDADYPTSLETQRRIKLAASSASSLLDDDEDEYDITCRNANDVLLALLDADPRECNAVIVVCTLTLSSKMLV